MAKKSTHKPYPPKKPTPTLRWVGFWATAWWAVSGLYVLWLFWLGKVHIEEEKITLSGNFWKDWGNALGCAFNETSYMPGLLAIILLVWLVGASVWLIELRKQKHSYKAAFKDLFFRIRK